MATLSKDACCTAAGGFYIKINERVWNHISLLLAIVFLTLAIAI